MPWKILIPLHGTLEAWHCSEHGKYIRRGPEVLKSFHFKTATTHIIIHGRYIRNN